MARLDRLAPVKEVAQVAAVIGREFAFDLLEAVVPPGGDLRAALDQLVAAELVFRRGEAAYAFKHALVRDAAYESLLRGRRQQLHGRIAAALEERFPDVAAAQPELLAQHYAGAGLAERAITYWLTAARLALARSANAEAVAQLDKGLALLGQLQDDPGRHRLELDLQAALGAALIAAKGFAAPETGRAWARALELCRGLPDSPPLPHVLYGVWAFHHTRAELDVALKVAGEVRALGERGRRPGAPPDGAPGARQHVGVAWRGRPRPRGTRAGARDRPAARPAARARVHVPPAGLEPRLHRVGARGARLPGPGSQPRPGGGGDRARTAQPQLAGPGSVLQLLGRPAPR